MGARASSFLISSFLLVLFCFWALGREVAAMNGIAHNLVGRPSPLWGCWLLVRRCASESLFPLEGYHL